MQALPVWSPPSWNFHFWFLTIWLFIIVTDSDGQVDADNIRWNGNAILVRKLMISNSCLEFTTLD